MGATPLTWQEIESWLRVTELNLTTWEILTIKSLTEAYVGEFNQASAKDRLAPYTSTDDEVVLNRDHVAKKALSIFRSFMRKPDPEEEISE